MIQALRDLIDLYTFYFDILERFLDGLLDLLCVCICQGKYLFLTYDKLTSPTLDPSQRTTPLLELAHHVCNYF